MAKLFKKKINWKKLIAVVLAGAAVLGCVGGLVAIFGKQTKTIGASAFSVGDIYSDGDKLGKPKDSTVAIYTKESFAYDGLRIVPEFDADCEYQIYYYDANDEYVSTSGPLTGAFEGVNPDADRARIVIRPNVPETWDEDKDGEFKIRFWEIRSYAKQLNITVNKDQLEFKTVSVNLMTGQILEAGEMDSADIETLKVSSAGILSTPTFKLNSVKYDYYRVYVKLKALDDNKSNVTVAFGDGQKGEDGVVSGPYKSISASGDEEGFYYVLEGADLSIDTWYSITVKTPKGADAFRVMGPDTAEYRIYGMNE